MNPVQKPNSVLLAELTELIAAGHVYNGGILHLYKTPVAFSPNMDLTAFTECDFSGYAPSATIVFGSPFIAPAGYPVTVGGLVQFETSNAPTILNTVQGWYLTNAAGTSLLFWRAFDTPVILTGPLQGVEVAPAIPAYLPS